jgi:two-component system, sensor histidine kinase YesM
LDPLNLIRRPVARLAAAWKRSTLKNRFLMVMILLTFFPIGVVGILSYRISRSAIENNHITSYSSTLAAFSNIIDLVLENVRKDSRVLLGHPEIQRRLTENGRAQVHDGSFDLASIRAFDQVVTQVTITNRDIDSVFLFDNDWRGYCYSRGSIAGSTTVPAKPRGMEVEPWYRKAAAAAGWEVFFGRSVLSLKDGSGTFSCVKLLRSIEDFRPIGLLVINVSKQFLSRHVPQAAEEAGRGSYFILDTESAEWNTVFSNGSGDVPVASLRPSFAGDPETLPPVVEKDGYLAIRHVNRTTGWSVVHWINRRDLFRGAERIGVATLAITIGMIFVVILLFTVVSGMLNRPLAKLERVIAEVGQGRRDVSEEFGADEIGMIGEQFQRMVRNNLELRERLLQADLKQREAELRALQAQVNPHFLYNTLDSMFWLAKVNKVESIATMALSLSNLFRSSLAEGRDVISVKDEIEHVRHYLAIQKLRYRDRFLTEIDVAPSLLECRILKWILQPLVENAVIHGLEAKVGQGHLRVSGRKEDEVIVFLVADDGVGMKAEDTAEGFGIRNVRERIRLFYGERFGVTLESVPGGGTTVRIALPYRADGNSSGEPPC